MSVATAKSSGNIRFYRPHPRHGTSNCRNGHVAEGVAASPIHPEPLWEGERSTACTADRPCPSAGCRQGDGPTRGSHLRGIVRGPSLVGPAVDRRRTIEQIGVDPPSRERLVTVGCVESNAVGAHDQALRATIRTTGRLWTVELPIEPLTAAPEESGSRFWNVWPSRWIVIRSIRATGHQHASASGAEVIGRHDGRPDTGGGPARCGGRIGTGSRGDRHRGHRCHRDLWRRRGRRTSGQPGAQGGTAPVSLQQCRTSASTRTWWQPGSNNHPMIRRDHRAATTVGP